MSALYRCWVERREADPRFDYGTDTFDPPSGTWAPECGHAACIEDDARCQDGHGWDCPVAYCRVATATAVCDLERGHRSAHLFSDEPARVLAFRETRQ